MMKLRETYENILNEAAKGPLAAFEYMFKAAGKGMIEANGALLKAIQKINPAIKQLNKATDKDINKAFARVEFKEYRKIISNTVIANQKKEIEKILKGFNLSNPQSIKQAKAEIANKLGIKNAVADDVVNTYVPKKSGSTGGKVVPTQNPYDALKPVVISQESKDAFVELMNRKGVKIKPQHLDDVMREVQKSVDIEVGKVEKIFEDPTFIKTLQLFNRQPIEKQDEIVKKAIEVVKKSYGDYLMGLKITEKTKNNLKSLYDGAVDAYFLGMKKRGEKFTLGNFLKWWALSIKITWGLFFASIYAESMRKEDEGFLDIAGFTWEKIKQAPLRFIISLLPGVNLIVSSGNLLYQTIVSGVTVGMKEIGWSTKPIPKGESGIFTNPDFPLNNKGNDPDGIR
jgi:hypothetical protein